MQILTLCALWVERGLGGTKGRKADTGMKHQIVALLFIAMHGTLFTAVNYSAQCSAFHQSGMEHQIVVKVAAYCHPL